MCMSGMCVCGQVASNNACGSDTSRARKTDVRTSSSSKRKLGALNPHSKINDNNDNHFANEDNPKCRRQKEFLQEEGDSQEHTLVKH
jgi:hypothetical protein